MLCNGVFDLLHLGHVLHLEAAKKLGDVLIVSVTADAHVNKPGRPIYDAHQRLSLVRSLKCVDEVIEVSELMDALRRVDPDIVVKGSDYEQLLPEHTAYCRAHGIEIVFTDTPKFSTTDTINEIRRRSEL